MTYQNAQYPQDTQSYYQAPSSIAQYGNQWGAPSNQWGTTPRMQLRTDRSLLTMVLLSIITFGIYALWLVARSGEDLNIIASAWDRRRTMNYWLVALLLAPFTLGIIHFYWEHTTCERIAAEQQRRGIPVDVTPADFWIWCVLGCLIIVGPFVYRHKWLTAMNNLSQHYNTYG